MLSRLLHQILDDRQSTERQSGPNSDDIDLLRKICDCYTLDNICYNITRPLVLQPTGSNTKMAYSDHIRTNHQIISTENQSLQINILPKEVKPFDWRDSDKLDESTIAFLTQIRELTSGTNGFSIPIKEKAETAAVVSMISCCEDHVWQQYIAQYKSELICIAHFIHERFSARDQLVNDPADYNRGLTHREIESLHWAALGKTSLETAAILGISRRSVDFHIENSKLKLNASTKAHAISKSISINLIGYVF